MPFLTMLSKMLCGFLVIGNLWIGIAFAFTDMSIEKLDTELSKVVQKAKQGDKNALNRFQKALKILSKIDVSKHTQEEMITRLQYFIEEGKVPNYIFSNRGEYKYVEGNNVLYLVGTNIRLRSQPNTKARVITTLNTDSTDYLTYLGNWKSPKGECWVLVMNSLNDNSICDIGWIFEEYTRFVPNAKIYNIFAKYQNSITNANINTNPNRMNNTEIKSININWGYVLLGVIVLGITYFIASDMLGWELTLENFLVFLGYAFCTIFVAVAVCAIAYIVLKFIWEEIIRPILTAVAAFFFLVGLAGTGENGGNGNVVQGQDNGCPYSNLERCEYCPKLDTSDAGNSGRFRCKHYYRYVDPEYPPEYNSNNLKIR